MLSLLFCGARAGKAAHVQSPADKATDAAAHSNVHSMSEPKTELQVSSQDNRTIPEIPSVKRVEHNGKGTMQKESIRPKASQLVEGLRHVQQSVLFSLTVQPGGANGK